MYITPLKVSWTTQGSLYDFHRPNQGLRLCSQGRSLEGSEEDWMPGQVRQHCVRSFHDGMMGCVLDDGEISSPFDISNGTKQGYVLAPMLFSIFFAMMLLVAFKDCDLGVSMQFRTDGSVFNLRRLQARTSVFSVILRDLLYADDCVLLAYTESVAQQLFDRFSNAARRFGLTVSLKKTEVMLQSAKGDSATIPVIKSGETVLKVVDRFCYLGSVVFWRWHW